MTAGWRLSRFFRSIPRQDGHAVYHSLLGGLCVVDETVRRTLERFASPIDIASAHDADRRLSIAQLDQLVEIFSSKGLLVSNGADERADLTQRLAEIEDQAQHGGQLGVVQLVVTNRCNFRCTYCFTNSIYSSEERLRSQEDPRNQTMSCEDACRYIEAVIAVAKRNGAGSLTIQFFGGEPLLNWPAVRAVLDHLAEGAGHGLRIDTSIVTNGSLATEEIAETLREHKVAVVMSYDSPRGTDRVLSSGRQVTDRLTRSLSILKRAGNRVVLNTVLSDETFPYFDIDLVDHAFENLVFEIGVLLSLDPWFYERHPAEAIVDRLWQVYEHGVQRGVVITGYWHTIFQQLCQHKAYRKRLFKTCSGTGCQLSIEPSGAVFACKGSSAYFGHVRDLDGLLRSPRYRHYARRAFASPARCVGCEIEGFCSGLCLGPLEKRHGDIFAVHEAACEVYRLITRRLIHTMALENTVVYTMSPAEQSPVANQPALASRIGANARYKTADRHRASLHESLDQPEGLRGSTT